MPIRWVLQFIYELMAQSESSNLGLRTSPLGHGLPSGDVHVWSVQHPITDFGMRTPWPSVFAAAKVRTYLI
jgi:hypothetical protein